MKLTDEQRMSLKDAQFSAEQLAVIELTLAEDDAQRDPAEFTPEQEAAMQASGISPELIAACKAALGGLSFSEGHCATLTPEARGMLDYLKISNPRAVAAITGEPADGGSKTFSEGKGVPLSMDALGVVVALKNTNPRVYDRLMREAGLAPGA